jgi:hypothetical protein
MVEFQVRFTSLDTLGYGRAVTLPQTDLGDASVECTSIRNLQDTYRLPVDACIWVRVGGGAWREWTGDVTRSCEMAVCGQRGAELLSACGIYYVCPACRESIACLTAIYQEQDAEDSRLAEAGAATA